MDQLGIFAKYWEPGKVKTRLAKTIGARAASEVYLEFLTTLVQRHARYPVDRHVLAYWPPGREADFRRVAPGPWRLQAQVPGDLGNRMAAYFQSAFGEGARHVVLIGSDCPLLGNDILDSALAALRDSPVVLGPSNDGGYYLVGGRSDMPDIFSGIPWSTSAVWSVTTARLDHADCQWKRLAVHEDIDDLQGLRRLAGRLDEYMDRAGDWWPLRETVARALGQRL